LMQRAGGFCFERHDFLLFWSEVILKRSLGLWNFFASCLQQTASI
jgi:hypothetical protein